MSRFNGLPLNQNRSAILFFTDCELSFFPDLKNMRPFFTGSYYLYGIFINAIFQTDDCALICPSIFDRLFWLDEKSVLFLCHAQHPMRN
jgi:hypothetical protein